MAHEGDVTEVYDLRVTVDRIEGRSACGMAVGDYFEVTESAHLRIPEGKKFCIWALASVLPFVTGNSGEAPARGLAGAGHPVLLPGPGGGLVMRVERTRLRRLDTTELT